MGINQGTRQKPIKVKEKIVEQPVVVIEEHIPDDMKKIVNAVLRAHKDERWVTSRISDIRITIQPEDVIQVRVMDKIHGSWVTHYAGADLL